jgi:hypothetical protein
LSFSKKSWIATQWPRGRFIKRVRISPKVYSSHSCYILENTQTEIFLQFKNEYPDVRIGQRAFEKCKPYFVRTAQFKDKLTCCCRQHVEMRSLFKTSFLENLPLGHCVAIHDFFEKHQDIHFWTEEIFRSACFPKYNMNERNILWDLFLHVWCLLVYWHLIEARNLELALFKTSFLENLPLGHCVAIHDFFENDKCTEQNEIQSSYFQKLEVSLHVAILHRQSVCLWTVLFVRNTVYIFRTPFALFLHQDIHFWTEEIFRSACFPKYNMNERNILWDLFLHVCFVC